MALVVVLSLAAACGGSSEPGYTRALRRSFVDVCVEARGGEGAPSCRCWYDRIAEEVPFEELGEIDDLVAEEGPEGAPDEIYTYLAECVFRIDVPRAGTTTTAP